MFSIHKQRGHLTLDCTDVCHDLSVRIKRLIRQSDQLISNPCFCFIMQKNRREILNCCCFLLQVYMSSSGLDWRPLLNTWLMKKPQGEALLLRSCFDESFSSVYQWSRQNLHYKMAVLECNIINQAIALLEGLIPVEEIQSKDNRSQSLSDSMPPEPPTDDADLDLDLKMESESASATLTQSWTVHLKRLYIFSLVWSVGALLERSDRYRLDEYIRSHYHDLPLPPRLDDNEESTVFDFVVGQSGLLRRNQLKIK